ncbi:hypothetical protein [Paracidovorax anthurii]|uniref:hypothetical protein n=1 Tax=Paracidovorax anthurii TaxID=78229 RepID=UPI0011BECFBC|nr:hypothetical protein [Paracidovorax anthurii]
MKISKSPIRYGTNIPRFAISLGILGFLGACNSSNDDSRVWIASSGYKYKSTSFKSPLLVVEKIIVDPPDEIILIACPTSTPSMIIPLQQILAKRTTSNIIMIREDCPD